MAAYAAVTSLLQSLDQLSQTDHSSYSVLYKKDQTEVLSEKYTFLKAFLEDFTNVFHEDIKMKHLERMIQEAAHGVEDTIDSHVYDSLVFLQSRRERRKANTIFHKNLEYAIEEIGLIQREVTKKIKFSRFNSKISHSRDTSSQFPLDQKDMIVGLDEDLLKIKDRLIVQSSRLEVVPIVGMGGIGKTTLARRVYDDSLITYHFYVRAWISVSQEFDRRDIFLGILQSISTVNDEVERNSTTEQLAERVYRSLKGRKYLILLDDMWSIEPWQHVRRSFPDDHNGSRIVLTTRLVDVASSASSANSLHQMRFLSMEESWTLLRDKVFGNDSYPPELEKIGRYIGHQCQGLPLAVVAIGGLLSKMRKETSSWENVAEKLEKLKVEFRKDYMHHHTLWRTADRVYIPRLHIPHYDNFPPKLKKLTLCKTHLQWEEMNFLRKLPNLEVLKLKDRAFHGEIWRLSEEDEEGFFRLKFLLLESMYLEQWEATSYHFPSLEHLVLTDCYSLEQIPFDFADIQTLQLIELHKCMHSVLVSAEQIQEEQQSLGNDDLVIRVNYIHKKIT
ncbi:putative late blight resistance protein homolog R1B-8 isoform X2 [Capsicum annuum]|uniref:putative late blight resistance protein homolog R1B-8 isoform X2 n=1 Tax=Capsicum annuum TaxID=4072 RepID=UPI001FB13A39|nr:putative late blight resistance protein homolog R1B-8 isoform X2 [Capsicum annuum]